MLKPWLSSPNPDIPARHVTRESSMDILSCMENTSVSRTPESSFQKEKL